VSPTFLSTGIKPSKEELQDFRLAPNPAAESVSIQGFTEPVLKVDILNLQGKVVGQFSNANQIDISDLGSGIYLIRVETESYTGMKRLVKV